MKVLVFTSLFPNNIFPIQGVFIKERMRAVSKLEGIAIKVVAPVPYFPPIKMGQRWQYRQVAREEAIEGIEVTHPRYFMTPKIWMSLYGLFLCLSVLPHLKRIQKTFDFDVIDSHFVYPDGFAAVLLGKIFKKPVIISARGSDINVYKELRVIPHLLKYALNRADRVVAVSHALANAIEELGITREKVAVVPNGVDGSKFFPEPQEEARRKLGLGSGKVVLSIGHLTRNKGFDLLLHALKILVSRRKEDDLQLIIIGEGVMQGELEQLVASLGLHKQVRFIGALPHHQLRVWYSAADVFCLASDREGWPNVVVESLACGTPVVATKAGGIPEILNARHLGILTERTSHSLAVSIEEALDRTWDRDAISREVQKHQWDQVAQKLMTIYKAVKMDYTQVCSAKFAAPLGAGRRKGLR